MKGQGNVLVLENYISWVWVLGPGRLLVVDFASHCGTSGKCRGICGVWKISPWHVACNVSESSRLHVAFVWRQSSVFVSRGSFSTFVISNPVPQTAFHLVALNPLPVSIVFAILTVQYIAKNISRWTRTILAGTHRFFDTACKTGEKENFETRLIILVLWSGIALRRPGLW